MARYLFTGTEPRYFPTLGVTLAPAVDDDGNTTGEAVEFETDQVVSHPDVLTAEGESTEGIDTPNNADPDPNRGLVGAGTTAVDEPIAEYAFEDLTKAELLDLAQDLALHGRSQMTKDELIAALRAAAQQTPADIDAATTTTAPVAGDGDTSDPEE